MIQDPIKTTRQITREKLVKPAFYKDVPTGEYQEVTIIGEDGVRRTEQREVTSRVFVNASRETVTETIDIWAVEHDGETHEFMTKNDADRFVEQSRQKEIF